MMQRDFSSYSSQANSNRQDRVGILVSLTTDNVISSHHKRILKELTEKKNEISQFRCEDSSSNNYSTKGRRSSLRFM